MAPHVTVNAAHFDALVLNETMRTIRTFVRPRLLPTASAWDVFACSSRLVRGRRRPRALPANAAGGVRNLTSSLVDARIHPLLTIASSYKLSKEDYSGQRGQKTKEMFRRLRAVFAQTHHGTLARSLSPTEAESVRDGIQYLEHLASQELQASFVSRTYVELLHEILKIWGRERRNANSTVGEASPIGAVHPSMFLRWIDDLAAVTTDRQIGDSVTISPTRETYRLLMDADMTNVDFVELLFQRMMRSVDRDVSPAVDDFHRVMHANIASGRLDRAETYLQSLVQLHRSNFCSESMYQPTARTYNLLIAGYAKTSRPHDSNRVLQQLLDDGFVEIPPPAYCFETCLNAWSSVSHKSAGHRIECLVLQMQQLGVAVTPRSFVKLIAAWTQSRRANAPQRARAILRLLLSVVDEELAKKTVLSNNDEMIDGPDRSVERAVLDAYLHVVRAFALTASRDRTAPDQCHALLKELLSSGRVAALQDATGSDSAAHRGTFRKICSMVCLAWARSKRRDAAQQIERLLHQLETDFGLPADRFCCNTLLEAHARHGDRKGALQTWNRFFESTGGKPALEPDVQSVNSVLLALDRSRDSWERSEAESFWDRVRSQFRVDPNVVTFNALLSLAGKSDKLEIARRGEAYLAQLELLHSNGDPACRPNPVTYAKAIELWENIRDHPEEATQRVQAHWATMKRKRIRPTEAACRAYAIVFQSNGESRVC